MVTLFGGLPAIHAAKGYGEDDMMAVYEEPFKGPLNAVGYLKAHQLPFGAIVAVCELVG